MAAPHSTSSEDSSLRVLHKLLKAQHTRCEAHRLWARALEETLSGQLSMTTYGATMNTLIAAMANTSAQFREVRDAVPTTDNATRKTLPSVVKQWATGVQLLEKELYDATVTLQRISLTHAAARCETTTNSLSADVANSSSTATPDDNKIVTHTDPSPSSSSPPPLREDNNVVKSSIDSPPSVGYAPHCVDCSIAGLVASLHRGTAASSTAVPTSPAALLDDDKIPAPVIVGTWRTTDDRNQFLFPAGHDGERSIGASLQEGGGNHPNDCEDDDDDDGNDDDDMQATDRQQHHHHKTSAHNCRVASEECNWLRSEVSKLHQRIGELMDEAMELIVDAEDGER